MGEAEKRRKRDEEEEERAFRLAQENERISEFIGQERAAVRSEEPPFPMATQPVERITREEREARTEKELRNIDPYRAMNPAVGGFLRAFAGHQQLQAQAGQAAMQAQRDLDRLDELKENRKLAQERVNLARAQFKEIQGNTDQSQANVIQKMQQARRALDMDEAVQRSNMETAEIRRGNMLADRSMTRAQTAGVQADTDRKVMSNQEQQLSLEYPEEWARLQQARKTDQEKLQEEADYQKTWSNIENVEANTDLLEERLVQDQFETELDRMNLEDIKKDGLLLSQIRKGYATRGYLVERNDVEKLTKSMMKKERYSLGEAKEELKRVKEVTKLAKEQVGSAKFQNRLDKEMGRDERKVALENSKRQGQRLDQQIKAVERALAQGDTDGANEALREIQLDIFKAKEVARVQQSARTEGDLERRELGLTQPPESAQEKSRRSLADYEAKQAIGIRSDQVRQDIGLDRSEASKIQEREYNSAVANLNNQNIQLQQMYNSIMTSDYGVDQESLSGLAGVYAGTSNILSTLSSADPTAMSSPGTKTNTVATQAALTQQQAIGTTRSYLEGTNYPVPWGRDISLYEQCRKMVENSVAALQQQIMTGTTGGLNPSPEQAMKAENEALTTLMNQASGLGNLANTPGGLQLLRAALGLGG